MVRKKMKKIEDGYSPEELDVHMHAYIKASAEHLRKELREAWKKQNVQQRGSRHEVTV